MGELVETGDDWLLSSEGVGKNRGIVASGQKDLLFGVILIVSHN